MNRLKIAVIGFVALVASPAAAATLTVNMTTTGSARIGVVGRSGIWLCTEPTAGGAPVWRFISDVPLNTNAVVNGTSGRDVIGFAQAGAGTFCGRSDWEPVPFNGHTIAVNGGSQNDAIVGMNGDTFGGANNDVVVASVNGFTASGDDGDDFVWGTAQSTGLFGGNDNDFMCAFSSGVGVPGVVLGMNGGNGSDSACGSAVFEGSIENHDNSRNCVPCALAPILI